ncbi:MAG TPA: DUF4259 domain-containing protein [Burkholderiaceae bacterium]|jgi:hypothetical protein
MGTWSTLPFGNDDAADWAYELDEPNDLGPIRQAIAGVLAIGDDAELELFEASAALAAIELLACLRGHPGDTETYTEAADAWLSATSIQPPAELLAQAQAAMTRVLAQRSELRELWQDGDEYADWLAAVADLRARVAA